LGIAVIGTLGIVLTAKQRGLIPLARPVIEQLLKIDMYLAADLMNAALAKVGE
jgi:predicted nucleic acid-binding protein